MPPVYSTYEAKAKFGEIIRKVRQGQRVLISYRGQKVAEVRPVTRPSQPSIEEVLKDLEDRGVLGPPAKVRASLKPLVMKPGALSRFLESRE
jgi:prevent-host-death family protein